jgi:IS5 family transposase
MATGDRGLSLRQGTIVDATLIHAPSSTKNQDGKRDRKSHQAKKCMVACLLQPSFDKR